MSQEKILNALVKLGFTQWDAKVYVILAKRGPMKAKDASKALKISKQRLYPLIKNLQSKGIVNSTLERPARFSAVPFEKVLDLFVKAKMEQAQRIKRNRAELLSDWQAIAIAESEEPSAKFTVIKGRSYVYSKIQQMIENTKNQLSFVATVPSLARADEFGLFDAAFNHPLKSKLLFRFLTEVSAQNVNAFKTLLNKTPKTDFVLEGRVPDLGLKLCPRMVIRDAEETVFFIDPKNGEFAIEQDDLCLWTNCSSLVHGFQTMFEDLWRNSTDIERKIVEVETGKPAPKTHIIRDAETAYRKYHDAMRAAKNEIIMITSSKGLIACGKSMSLVKEWSKRHVSLKIMAPITSKNIEIAQQLIKYCEVKHVPAGYLGTTVVDGQHLFQFKNPPHEAEKLQVMPYFKNTFYTNDSEYVEKTKTMLDAIWRTGSAPSASTLEYFVRPPSAVSLINRTVFRTVKKINGLKFVEEESHLLEKLTEKEILNKIIKATKYPAPTSPKDIVRFYSSNAQAIIHPPPYFNLPDMLFHIFHIDKNSSFGAEDSMVICTWLETPKGCTYVPSAFIGDNPASIYFWKKFFAGLPVEQNVQLVKKDELQIRVHGNTYFTGWTVPIPLISPFILPPSCILIEGYGDVKTISYSAFNPSGHKTTTEGNGFEAFVTFIHPSSKYTGPGTDGFFGRDAIMTMYPP